MAKSSQTKKNAVRRNLNKAHAVRYGSRGAKYQPRRK